MVSVIVPVYGVERYIERCVRSLMSQTLEEVEFIFIDDASPDSSMSILEAVMLEYPSRNVRVYHHDYNKGLPASRNTGMKYAKGDYVYHCDSDDYMDPHMLEDMYLAAVANNADMVWCDIYLSYENNERYMKQPSYESGSLAMKGMLDGSMKYNVWNKLVRGSLYKDYSVSFPDGHSMGEDMTMICLASLCNRVVHIPKAYYHYVKTNTGAMTNSLTVIQQKSLLYNVNKTIDFLLNGGISGIEKEIACFKLNAKLPLLIGNNTDFYRLWSDWFPEANSYIWDNKGNSMRVRFVEYMASKRFFLGVRIYYFLVHKLLYGFLYR